MSEQARPGGCDPAFHEWMKGWEKECNLGGHAIPIEVIWAIYERERRLIGCAEKADAEREPEANGIPARKPKTMRVRAAVVVSADRRFAVYGADGLDDGEMIEVAMDCLVSPLAAKARIAFIEADAPLPDAEVIKAEVTK